MGLGSIGSWKDRSSLAYFRHPEVLALLGEPRRMGHRHSRPSFETPRKTARLLRMTAEFVPGKEVDKRRATTILARFEGRQMAIYVYMLRCADNSYYIG